MQVAGYDPARAAWRVTVGRGTARLTGWVPEALVRADTGRPPHEDVYRWLDRHETQIERALAVKARGGVPASPYDGLTLGEE